MLNLNPLSKLSIRHTQSIFKQPLLLSCKSNATSLTMKGIILASVASILGFVSAKPSGAMCKRDALAFPQGPPEFRCELSCESSGDEVVCLAYIGCTPPPQVCNEVFRVDCEDLEDEEEQDQCIECQESLCDCEVLPA